MSWCKIWDAIFSSRYLEVSPYEAPRIISDIIDDLDRRTHLKCEFSYRPYAHTIVVRLNLPYPGSSRTAELTFDNFCWDVRIRHRGDDTHRERFPVETGRLQDRLAECLNRNHFGKDAVPSI